MCGFTFTVFLSAFQLLPTAPYPHPGAWRQHAGVRAVSRIPDLFVRVLRAGHRRPRRPPRLASHPAHLQPDARRLQSALCGHSRLPRDARAGARARCVLVRPAFGVGGVPDQHAAGAAARGRDRLLGAVDRWPRSRSVRRWASGSSNSAGVRCASVAAVLNLVMAAIAWHLPPQVIKSPPERAPRSRRFSNGASCCCR